MYICSSCGGAFLTENSMLEHYMKCWKDKNPGHTSKPAPRSQDTETCTGAQQMESFLEGLKWQK